MSSLPIDTCDTASSQDSKYNWLLGNSTGSLLFDYHNMNWHRWDDNSVERVCRRYSFGLLIREIESADILDYVPLKPEISDEVDLDLSHFKEQVATIFGELSQVRAVFIIPYDDHFKVETFLSTRDRQVRSLLFDKELSLHDSFPDIVIDFRVSLTPNLPTARDLPDEAVCCFER